MMNRSRWSAGLAAIALLLVIATAAVGYAGQVAGSVVITIGAPDPSNPTECATPVPVTVTVLETGSGRPIEGQPVTIGFDASVRGDSLNNTSPTTNANGKAEASVIFVCRPGARVLFAIADDARGRLVIRGDTLGVTFAPSPEPASAAVAGATGLPNTSTAGLDLPILVTALLGATGAGMIVRRYALARP